LEITFWGVRGSIATPGSDMGYFGGNTSCIAVRAGTNQLILDAGTGLRPLGTSLMRGRQLKRSYHLLLSHFHLDHLSGLPFFQPLYQKGVSLHIYGPKGNHRSLRQIIATLFNEEYFPLPLKAVPAHLRLHSLREQNKRISGFSVTSFYLNHPGSTLGYIIESNNKRLAYITDHEPIRQYRHCTRESVARYEKRLQSYLSGVDLMIHDAQYLNRQYPHYRGWGHSPWSYAIQLAKSAGVSDVVLYHHDPANDDQTLKHAWARLKAQKNRGVKIHLARERQVIRL